MYVHIHIYISDIYTVGLLFWNLLVMNLLQKFVYSWLGVCCMNILVPYITFIVFIIIIIVVVLVLVFVTVIL